MRSSIETALNYSIICQKTLLETSEEQAKIPKIRKEAFFTFACSILPILCGYLLSFCHSTWHWLKNDHIFRYKCSYDYIISLSNMPKKAFWLVRDRSSKAAFLKPYWRGDAVEVNNRGGASLRKSRQLKLTAKV